MLGRRTSQLCGVIPSWIIGRANSQLPFTLAFCALCGVGWGIPNAYGHSAFRVERVHSYLRRGVYWMDADFDLRLNRQAKRALSNGVPLTFAIQVRVVRPRRFLWNEVVGRLTERFRLIYQPLSRTYKVENLNSGNVLHFNSLRQALTSISTINHLPLIDSSLLARHQRYLGALRIVVDKDDLPEPLRLLSIFISGWKLDSPWKSWVLAP